MLSFLSQTVATIKFVCLATWMIYCLLTTQFCISVVKLTVLKMFEGSKEYTVSSQDPLCLSFSKNTVIGNSKINVEENKFKQIEAAHNSILNELIDNAILELCFEVHRAAKLSFPIPAQFIPPDKLIENSGKSAKSTKSIICYGCGVSKGPLNFTTHLSGCLKSNGRKARTKMINFKECDSEEEDYDDYDTEAIKKAKRNKKGVRGKSRLLGNSVSKPSYNSTPSYMDMSIDERKAFFDMKCGVVTKRNKKLCSNSRNCAYHTEIERTSVRHDLLRDELDNRQIDVDTVETSDMKPSFSTCDGTISDYSSGSLAYF